MERTITITISEETADAIYNVVNCVKCEEECDSLAECSEREKSYCSELQSAIAKAKLSKYS